MSIYVNPPPDQSRVGGRIMPKDYYANSQDHMKLVLESIAAMREAEARRQGKRLK